jgi:hypothetical protein
MRAHHPGRGTLTEQHGEHIAGPHRPAPGRTTLVEQQHAELSPLYQLDRSAPDIPAEVGVHAEEGEPPASTDMPAHEATGAKQEAPGGDAELRALGVERRVEPSDATVPGENDSQIAHASAGLEHASAGSGAASPVARAASAGSGSPVARAASSGHHMAPTDEFNKSGVSSRDNSNAQQLFRPGVRFGGPNGVDILHPKVVAHRWLIDDHGVGHARDLVTPNTSVAFNLAPLLHRGGETWALTFVKGKGALWMSLNAFRDAGNIEQTIRTQAVPVLPSANVGAAARRVFRSASSSDGMANYKDLYILPGKGGLENKLDHYRYRGNTHLYNVLLNLPQTASPGQNEAPPVAVDSAQPGWSFFVAAGAKFRRQVPLFNAGSDAPTLFVTFVYGFIGKTTRQGEQRDVNRRGWVLKGTLAMPS